VDNDSDKSDLRKFLAEQPDIVWPQLFGASGEHWHPIAERFAVKAIPTLYVIDRNGVLREIETGSIPEKQILKMLDEPYTPASTTRTAKPATRPLSAAPPVSKS